MDKELVFINGDNMVSTEEIDIILAKLGYYIILDGGINIYPNMDNYDRIKNFIYLTRQNNNDIIIECSESDSKTYYFNQEEFNLWKEDLINELVIESFQDYINRQFLYGITSIV